MNSLDNYLWYQTRLQGVSLFSTNPSKGLLRALKQTNRQVRFMEPVKMNRSGQSEAIHLYNTIKAKDTTATDTINVQ